MQYLFLQGAKYRKKYTVSCKKYGRGYVSASRCAKSQDMTMRKGCARAIAHSQLHMSALRLAVTLLTCKSMRLIVLAPYG
jgi:hypothetical protein